MTPLSQVKEVAPSYQPPDFHPINFNLTTRDGSVRYQDFCFQFTKKIREKEQGPDQSWQHWEAEVDVFIHLLKHSLPRSLRLAQAKVRELQADFQVSDSCPLIQRVRNGIKGLLDEGSVSKHQLLRTKLAEDLLIELFGGWNEARLDEPHGRQLVDILLALGVQPPGTVTHSEENQPGLNGEVQDRGSLQEVSSVVASMDAGHAAQERRGHSGSGQEGGG